MPYRYNQENLAAQVDFLQLRLEKLQKEKDQLEYNLFFTGSPFKTRLITCIKEFPFMILTSIFIVVMIGLMLPPISMVHDIQNQPKRITECQFVTSNNYKSKITSYQYEELQTKLHTMKIE
jgi:hypothetical protein